MTYCYQAYGLGFESQIAFPELTPADGPGQIFIRYGSLDPGNADTSPECLIRFEGIGTFLVREGIEILVDPDIETDSGVIRVFLMCLCFAIILHQRGILAMHASSIQTSQGAILFTGPAGCGKSTLMGAFLKRGYRMLADDVTGIALGPGDVPQVLPAFPQTKLWRDSAGMLGHDVSGLERVLSDLDKYKLPTTNHFADEPSLLRAVYVLEPWNGKTTQIDELENSAKFDVFVGNTFRLAVTAAKAAAVRRVRRPSSGFHLDELADRIEQDFRAMDPQRR